MGETVPRAILAVDAPPRKKTSNYPQPFAERVEGRVKAPLGNVFGLKNFGVNLARLAPGAMSALMHSHTVQDEFVYVLEGELTLVTPEGETVLTPGMCAGFPAGGLAHHLVNKSDRPGVYLEVGDRLPGDEGHYPMDDLAARLENGAWLFTRKDGTPY